MNDSQNTADDEPTVDLQIADVIQGWMEQTGSDAEPISADELVAQHPELAPQLEHCLNGLVRLERGKSGISLDASDGKWDGDSANSHLSFPQIPDFEILDELGRGGMGVVYRARQCSLDRIVALKILPSGSVDPTAADRFTREAETAATLHHTNIVPIHAVGHHNGLHWYAMQHIDGETVSQWASQQESSTHHVLDEAIRIGIAAAEALQHAHERGVIHRDVKPGNLMLDQERHVWLTDFGLARRNTDVTATATGAMLGTPRYMSAEQINCTDAAVDHRTDIYSLGATLYELITRKPVFDAPSPIQLLSSIQRDEPASPRALNPRVPRELALVLLKALDKDPDRRYQTAQSMANDLRAVRDHQPIEAKGLPLWIRANRWYRRHREKTGSIVTATLTTAAAVLAVLGLWRQYRQSQMGQLQIETDGRLHYASIQRLAGETLLNDPIRVTAPNQQPLEIAKGTYRLRMDGEGRFSETAIAKVSSDAFDQIRYVDRRNPAPTINIKNRLAIPTVDGGLAVLGKESLEVFDARATPRFSIDCNDLMPDWEQDPKAARHNAAPKLVYGYNHEKPFEGDHSVLQSAFARAPRIVRDFVDLDQDGRSDLLVTGRGFAALTAISHNGDVLWKRLLSLPVDPSIQTQSHYPNNGIRSTIVAVLPVQDLDDDSTNDLLVSAVWLHSSGKVQNFLVTISGATGSQLAVHHFPVMNINQTKHWPFGGLLKHHRGFGSESRQARYLLSLGQEDQRRTKTHTMHGLTWTGPGVGGAIYSLGKPLVAEFGQQPIAVVATDKELHFIDLKTAEPAVDPTRLAMPIFGGPKRVAVADGDWGVIALTTVPNKQWSANHLSLCVPGEEKPRWTQPVQLSALELYASASAPDLPLCVDLNDDGADEILSSKLSKPWTSMPQLECLASDSGRSLWDTSPPIVSISSTIEKCVVCDDMNGDGWKELIVGSLAVWPRPHPANNEIRLLVDVISGRDGNRIGYREESLFSQHSSGNTIEIDHFSFDPATGLVSASIVHGASDELQLETLAVQIDLSGKQDSRVARGLTHLSPPTKPMSGGFYRMRPGPFSTQTDSAIWLRPTRGQSWLGGERFSSLFLSRDGALRFLVRGSDEGKAHCIDAASGETVWKTDVPCDSSAHTFHLPCEDGSVDLVVQRNKHTDAIPTIIDGETGRVQFIMDEFPFGEIVDLTTDSQHPYRFFYALADAESRDARNRNRTVGPQGYLVMKVDRQSGTIVWSRRCYSSMQADRTWERPSKLSQVNANEDDTVDLVTGDIQNGRLVVRALDGKNGDVIWTHNLDAQPAANRWPRKMPWPAIETVDELGFVLTLRSSTLPDRMSMVCLDTLSGDLIDAIDVPVADRSFQISRNPVPIQVLSKNSQSAIIATLTEAIGKGGRHTAWTTFQIDSNQNRFKQVHQHHYDRQYGVYVLDIDHDGTHERIGVSSTGIECRKTLSDEIIYQVDVPGQWIQLETVVWVDQVPTLRYRTEDGNLAWLDLRDGSRFHCCERQHSQYSVGRLILPTVVRHRSSDITHHFSSDSNHHMQWSMVGMTNEGFYIESIDGPSDHVNSKALEKNAAKFRLNDPDKDPRYHRSFVIAHPFKNFRFSELALRAFFASGLLLGPVFYIGRVIGRRQLSLRFLLVAPVVSLVAIYSYQGLKQILGPDESLINTVIIGSICGLGLIALIQLILHRQWKILASTAGFCIAGAAVSFLMISLTKSSVHDEIQYHLTWPTLAWSFVAAIPLIAPGLAIGYFVYLMKRRKLAGSSTAVPAKLPT